MTSDPKVIIVMPAYNAAKTLKKTLLDIPPDCYDEIILVDDASQDNTVDVARQLGLKVIRHEKNKGYGGNQKTCYQAAIKSGADIVVMLHPDYQYDAKLVPFLIGFIKNGVCDIVLGNRIRSRRETLKNGMPLYKYISNRFLTIIENVILGQNLAEFHSGFRAYNRKILETIPYEANSDDFVFDSEFLIQAVNFGFRIGTVPVPVRYFKEASSIDFINSTFYGLKTLLTLFKFILAKAKIYQAKIFKRKYDSRN